MTEKKRSEAPAARKTQPMLRRPLPARHHAELSTVLIGMVHLPRLLEGSHCQHISQIAKRAAEEALLLADAGFDGLILENFGDTPFYPDQVPPHTIAAMTRVACAVQDALLQKHSAPPMLGINILRNDALAALAVAAACEAAFIRVNIHSGAMITDQGLIEGKAHQTIRQRQQIAPHLHILADIRVKHAAPLAPRPPADEAIDTWQRAHADGLVLSGSHTGSPIKIDFLREMRQALPECPLYIGSGASIDLLPELLPHATGIIVGSSLKPHNDPTLPLDPQKVHHFVKAARKR